MFSRNVILILSHRLYFHWFLALRVKTNINYSATLAIYTKAFLLCLIA